jgi:hypothetical protein
MDDDLDDDDADNDNFLKLFEEAVLNSFQHIDLPFSKKERRETKVSFSETVMFSDNAKSNTVFGVKRRPISLETEEEKRQRRLRNDAVDERNYEDWFRMKRHLQRQREDDPDPKNRLTEWCREHPEVIEGLRLKFKSQTGIKHPFYLCKGGGEWIKDICNEIFEECQTQTPLN